MSDLKPCPFCGGVPTRDNWQYADGYKYVGIACCIVGPTVRTNYSQDPKDWIEDAVNEWNTRVGDSHE